MLLKLLFLASYFIFFVEYISYWNIFSSFSGSYEIEMDANIENLCISDDDDEVESVEEVKKAPSTKRKKSVSSRASSKQIKSPLQFTS